jgi:hypothetical protein
VKIIRVRRRVLMAARALAEQGETPPGVDTPEVFGARAGGVFLPNDAEWLEATEELAPSVCPARGAQPHGHRAAGLATFLARLPVRELIDGCSAVLRLRLSDSA